MGGKLHLMLRTCLKPIVHKYHEGKMKRTLERELKVTEIAEWEADGSSEAEQFCCALQACSRTNARGAMLLRVLCVVSFAFPVSPNSQLRNRAVTCNPCCGKVKTYCMICLGILAYLFIV